jgi:hypothetical protein
MKKPINKEFRKVREAGSKRTIDAMRLEALSSKFNVGTQNKRRLRQSLAVTGHNHLEHTTLLSPDVHKIHAEKLELRYLKKWNSISSKYENKIEAKSKFRFLTLLDCIEFPSTTIALRTIEKFKNSLESITHSSTGIWLLGCIEVEVVSFAAMRKIKKLTTTASGGETRKLDVCEKLLEKLKEKDRHLDSYLLIHFHGLVTASSERRFHEFRKLLEKNKRWKSARWQIELKQLSEAYGGKSKSVELNLKDIARYITKGGNDWIGKKSYLRYKVSFDNEYLDAEEYWIQSNWRTDDVLRGEHQEDGLEDSRSMTRSEILLLAQVIDGMMDTARGRTGYLVAAQSKREKLTTTASSAGNTGSLRDFL